MGSTESWSHRVVWIQKDPSDMGHFLLDQADPSLIQPVPERFQGWDIHDNRAAVDGIDFQHPITGGYPERSIHVPALLRAQGKGSPALSTPRVWGRCRSGVHSLSQTIPARPNAWHAQDTRGATHRSQRESDLPQDIQAGLASCPSACSPELWVSAQAATRSWCV